MSETHGGHALIETVAALILTLGGAAVVIRAWLERRRAASDLVAPGAALGSHSSRGLIAVLSGAAAVIHLAAAPEHVEELGDLGLGFYWAALLQGAFAIAWLLSARSPSLAVAGIALDATLIAVWAWSRTVGAGLPAGPESVGMADGIAVLLEAGLVAMLAGSLKSGRRSLPIRAVLPATSAAIAIGGVAVLATAIAVIDLGKGHGHATSRVDGTAAEAIAASERSLPAGR